jgi:hypothetical protein
MCKYDLTRLRKDASVLEIEVKELRKRMRQPGRNPTWQECLRKAELRWQLTGLYTFRAHLRGRVHSSRMVTESPGHVQGFIETHVACYLLVSLPAFVSPSAEPTGLGVPSPENCVGVPVLDDLKLVSDSA